MIYKTMYKHDFKKFLTEVMKDNTLIAPVIKDYDKNKKPVYQFDQVWDYDEIDFNYTKSYSSIKNFFIPYEETLSRFDFSKSQWSQQIEYTIHPRVIFGARSCDVDALLKLDKVLMHGHFPNPYYIARRKNTFIIGLDHEALEDCFCRSVGSDNVSHGFDIFLTDMGEKYFMKINSSKAMEILSGFEIQEVTEEDQEDYKRIKSRIRESFTTKVDISDLSNLMDLEFESDVWKKWGSLCLSCGSCAMVCPTCYCYTVTEEIDPSLRTASKKRALYSCNLVDFAEVAGGHNFRPDPEKRLKYRFYHQHRGFVESYDEPKCVGCNRCGDACPVGINPAEIIADLNKEHIMRREK